MKVKSQCSILKYCWLSTVGSCLRRTHKLTPDSLILVGEAPLKEPENEAHKTFNEEEKNMRT